jgi:hypothetical protein
LEIFLRVIIVIFDFFPFFYFPPKHRELKLDLTFFISIQMH